MVADVHPRAGAEALVETIIIVDTPDWGTADLKQLPYRHAPRGIFPLARDATWQGLPGHAEKTQLKAGQGDD